MGLRTWKGAFGASLALTAAAGALWAASASAGVYHVYSCRTPGGEGAPVDGWSPAASGAWAVTQDTCAQPGGGLLAALREGQVNPSSEESASWRFAGAPPGERVAAATLWRAGDADGGQQHGSSWEYWIGADRANAFDECRYAAGCTNGRGNQSEPLSSENVLMVPPASLGGVIYASAACMESISLPCPESSLGGDGFAAAVVIYAADFTLEQAAGPSVAKVGGELATAPSVRGTSDVTFTTSDPAAGVYEALSSVDGAIVQRTPLDENGGRCRAVGQASDGSAAFLYLQPCVSSASADVALDTTTLANGAHEVRVTVTDAAGNSALVLARTITVSNALPCSAPAPGAPATIAQATTGEAVLRAGWRGAPTGTITSGLAQAHVIDGRLTNTAGAPIAGAPIEGSVTAISTTPAPAPASVVARTGADGRFSVRIPGGGPSRVVGLDFRSVASPAARAATLALRLRVRAAVSLRVKPHTASVGRTIRFAGALAGGDVPRTGKAVILEARSPGSRWLQFRVVRADARGRFHASYRFRFPGPASYEFRAVCEPESDYPFAAGSSKVVRVRER